MENRKIVYVEDEEDYQALVSRILGDAGVTVQVADNGHDGMRLLERGRPDLLLLDINLPDTDGFSICRTLRDQAIWKTLPILMLTVRRRPEEWRNGYSCGANDYVSKPLNPPEFLERIQSCLEGKGIQPTIGPEDAEYQMIQAAAAGNKGAFDVLVRQYRPILFRAISAQIGDLSRVEDIVSATFETALAQLSEFEGNSSFQTYLYGIALRHLYHEYRRPHHQNIETCRSSKLSEIDPALERAETETEITRAKEALSELPFMYRKVIEMGLIKNIDGASIAKRLGIPHGTVRSRLNTATRMLRRAWDKTLPRHRVG
jgi:RNA polymerase sigma factor (sigma-70 family)